MPRSNVDTSLLQTFRAKLKESARRHKNIALGYSYGNKRKMKAHHTEIAERMEAAAK